MDWRGLLRSTFALWCFSLGLGLSQQNGAWGQGEGKTANSATANPASPLAGQAKTATPANSATATPPPADPEQVKAAIAATAANFATERAQAVSSGSAAKTSPELMEQADSLAARAEQALKAGRLVDAQSLYMRARFALPSLPARLPEGVNKFLGDSRPRHAEAVLCLAYHPSGTSVASGCRDGSIRLWEVPTGREKGQLLAHKGEVRAMAYTPDGNFLLTAGDDSEVRLWDLKKLEVVQLFQGHQEPITAVAISADGKTVATGGGDRKLRLYERATGKMLSEMPGHGLSINGVSISPDGKLVASACADQRLRVFDTATGGVKLALPQFQGNQYAVVFLKDNRTVALAGARPNRVLLIDTRDGSVRASLEGHNEAVTGLSLSEDGKRLATISDDRTARVYEVPEGKPLVVQALEDIPKGVAISPDGNRVAVGGLDRQVRWFELASTNQTRSLPGAGTTKVNGITGGNGNTALVASNDGTLRLLRGEDGTLSKEVVLDKNGALSCVATSPDTFSLAAVGGLDGKVRLLNAITLETRQILEGHDKPITAVAVGPSDTRVATGDSSGKILIWKPGEAKPVEVPPPCPGPVTALAFAGDGQWLAAATNDPVIRLYSGGQAVRDVRGASSMVVALTGLPNTKKLAAGCADGLGLVWNLDQPESGPGTFKGHTQGQTKTVQTPLTAIAARGDGKLLATAGSDGIVRLWDPTTLEEWKALSGAGGWVTGLAFGDRGLLLFGITPGSSPRAWDLESSRDQSQGLGHTREVKALAFSPDGKTLASTSLDQTTRTWDATTGRAKLMLESAGAPSLVFAPSGNELLVGGPDRNLTLFATANGKRQKGPMPLGPGGQPNALVVQGAQKRAIAWLGDGTLEAWPVEGMGPREVWRLMEGSGLASCLAFSGDGQVVALGLKTGAMQLFSLGGQPGKLGAEISAHQGPVLDTSMDAKGAKVATADSEAVVVWDTATRKPISRIPTEKGKATYTLSLSPSGNRVAAIGRDSVVRLFDTATGNMVKSWAFPGPGAANNPTPRAMAFSPDGKALAIGTAEGWICLVGAE